MESEKKFWHDQVFRNFGRRLARNEGTSGGIQKIVYISIFIATPKDQDNEGFPVDFRDIFHHSLNGIPRDPCTNRSKHEWATIKMFPKKISDSETFIPAQKFLISPRKLFGRHKRIKTFFLHGTP